MQEKSKNQTWNIKMDIKSLLKPRVEEKGDQLFPQQFHKDDTEKGKRTLFIAKTSSVGSLLRKRHQAKTDQIGGIQINLTQTTATPRAWSLEQTILYKEIP